MIWCGCWLISSGFIVSCLLYQCVTYKRGSGQWKSTQLLRSHSIPKGPIFVQLVNAIGFSGPNNWCFTFGSPTFWGRNPSQVTAGRQPWTCRPVGKLKGWAVGVPIKTWGPAFFPSSTSLPVEIPASRFILCWTLFFYNTWCTPGNPPKACHLSREIKKNLYTTFHYTGCSWLFNKGPYNGWL